MPATSSVSIGARTVHLHTFTGEVTGSARSTETEHTREAGSGRLISSGTWYHNEITVRAPDGEVRALDVGSAKIPVATGQTVTLAWGIVGRAEKGDYVAVHNHTNGQMGYFAKGVNDVAGPPLYNMLLIAIVFLVVANAMGTFRGESGSIILVAIGLGAFWWILQRRKKLRTAVEAAVATLARIAR